MSSNTAVTETKTAQIIQFPTKGYSNRVTTPEEVHSNLLEMRILAIEDGLSFIVPTLFEAISAAGFSLDDDRLNNLTVATLRALMYNHYGLPHPLSHFVDQNSAVFDQIFTDQMGVEDLDEELVQEDD